MGMRGVQADKRGIRIQAAGHQGGLAGYDLSARRAQDTARSSHAWAAPTLKPLGQSPAGQAGGGGTVALGPPGLPPATQHPNVPI